LTLAREFTIIVKRQQGRSTTFANQAYIAGGDFVRLLIGRAMKARTLEGFGPRLAQIRKSRGLTQGELGERVGVSYRMIAHYERRDAQPPGPILPDLARALGVSADELLGIEPLREEVDPKTARLLKRLRRIEKLPPADQRAVLKILDALIDARDLRQVS
jgi:transcriptional regulator with XRE-family HTH domain